MNAVFEAIKDDIKATVLAFEKEDFNNMNIFANRIMANTVFEEDNTLFLSGFFLKDIALIYGRLKRSSEVSAFSTAKSLGTSFIQKLSKYFSKISVDQEKLWNDYYKFHSTLREVRMNEIELESYSKNHAFTEKSFQWLLNYLEKNQALLLCANNNLLKGILNEMERIFRVHGGEIKALFIMSLIGAFKRYYSYFQYAYLLPQPNVDKKQLEKDLFPLIGDIKEVLIKPQINISKYNTILWSLVKKWREFFIEYTELIGPTISIEKGIEIPKETKEKLAKSITETLEKEIKSWE